MVVRSGRGAMDRVWRLLRLGVVASVLSSAAPGCGDDTPAAGFAGTGIPVGLGGTTGGVGGMAGTDGAGGGAGFAGSPVEPTACPAAAVGAPAVTIQLIAADPPVIDGGGPLVDGVYYMTESLVFSGPDGAASSNYGSYKDTLVIAHAATTGIARVTEVVEGDTTRLQRFTMRSAGSTLEVSDTCPAFEFAKYRYSYRAAGTTLSILGMTRLVVYTRQE